MEEGPRSVAAAAAVAVDADAAGAAAADGAAAEAHPVEAIPVGKDSEAAPQEGVAALDQEGAEAELEQEQRLVEQEQAH